MQRGIATFTLDYGTCPKWLFSKMVKLGREIIRVLVAEFGPDEFIQRIADPVWFQSLGTVLAFDWNRCACARNESPAIGAPAGTPNRMMPDPLSDYHRDGAPLHPLTTHPCCELRFLGSDDSQKLLTNLREPARDGEKRRPTAVEVRNLAGARTTRLRNGESRERATYWEYWGSLWRARR